MVDSKHFNIFYSWQSDLNKKANNYFIKDCIEKAIKELKKEKSTTITPRLDRDTKGMTGSPKITETILSKIDSCNIFIADISLINSSLLNKALKKKLTPNPNVLFELGYALYRLGWERIICLNNESFSNIQNMPFDLQQNRISQYNFDGNKNKENSQNQLVSLIKTAILGIIKNYDAIETKESRNNIQQHDIKVFDGLDKILSDTQFQELLNHIAIVNRVIDYEYKQLDDFCFYLEAERNKFLHPELNKATENILLSISNLKSILAMNLESNYESWFDMEEKTEKERTLYKLPKNHGHFSSYEEYSEDIKLKMEEIGKAIDDSLSTYTNFRFCIKVHLFI